jgi:hypothetical protein
MSTSAYAARSGRDSPPHDTGRDCDCYAQAVFTVRTPAGYLQLCGHHTHHTRQHRPVIVAAGYTIGPLDGPPDTGHAMPPGALGRLVPQPAVPQRPPQGLI